MNWHRVPYDDEHYVSDFIEAARTVLYQFRKLDRRFWFTTGGLESVSDAVNRGVVDDYGMIVEAG